MSLPINSDLLKIKNDLKNMQGQFNRSGTEMGQKELSQGGGSRQQFNASQISNSKGGGYKNSKQHSKVEMKTFIKEVIDEHIMSVVETLKNEL